VTSIGKVSLKLSLDELIKFINFKYGVFMKTNWLLLPSLALVLCACEQSDKTVPPSRTVDQNNSTIDANSNSVSVDQSTETEADRTLAQRIRKAIGDDSSLSSNARNIIIVTRNGIVTIRGTAKDSNEKSTIELKIQRIPGVSRVNNQLDTNQ